MSDSFSESDIDLTLAEKLLAKQFPQWADLPLVPVKSDGTDNAIFRLGKEMAVRLPRFKRVADHVEKEHIWLPKLSPFLPLAIPAPIGKGIPSLGYPWNWSVYRWIEGEMATSDRIADQSLAATALGQFITALQKIDTSGGPLSGQHNEYRGVALSKHDPYSRTAITTLKNVIDTDTATALWDEALQIPMWGGKPVWLHGDLHEGNLLAHRGALSAVIDFGLMGVGDPACDLMVGWTLLSKDARKVFRSELKVDDATWARGKGWALFFGLVALACYLKTNPGLAGIARRTLDEVLADDNPN